MFWKTVHIGNVIFGLVFDSKNSTNIEEENCNTRFYHISKKLSRNSHYIHSSKLGKMCFSAYS